MPFSLKREFGEREGADVGKRKIKEITPLKEEKERVQPPPRWGGGKVPHS